MNNNFNPFYCYSEKLKNFLCSQGLRYISKDVHKVTKRKFWIFLPSEELDIVRKMYKNIK